MSEAATLVFPNRYKDFDSAVDETDAIHIRVAGREYELPGSIPASLVLTQMRSMTEGGSIPTQAVPQWLEALVGKANLDKMIEDGMSWKKLEAVTTHLLHEYGVVTAVSDDDGEDADSGSDVTGNPV